MYEDAIDPRRVAQMIDEYFKVRGLKKPTPEQAVLWAMTELGEAADELLRRSGPWVRNNPEKMRSFDRAAFVEELGDTILMLLIAAHELDRSNPLVAMVSKIERKIAEEVHARVAERHADSGLT